MNIGEITDGVVSRLSDMKVEPGDYERDGSLFCGKCGELKANIKRNSLGEKLYLWKWCDCERAKCEESEQELQQRILSEANRAAEQERQRRLSHIQSLREKAFSDVRLRQWTFENDDNANELISSVARKYVEHFSPMKERGKGLLLYGGVGTGKTYIAACIANALVDDEVSCRMTNFSRLANEWMARDFEEKQRFLNSLNSYDLLVIDDLGSERSTEFMNEVVYSVIDARHKSRRPMIVTTNLSGDNLKHPADLHSERIFSRLFEMCIPVEVKGQDRRKLQLRDSDKDLKAMLGLIDGEKEK